MSLDIFQVDKRREYQKAGPFDLIRLLPAPGNNALFLPKFLIEIVVYGIANCEITRLCGPSGSAKTSLIEALYQVPENFNSVCGEIGFPKQPLKVYPIDLSSFKSAEDLYHRGAPDDGVTRYQESELVKALDCCAASNKDHYNLIWLQDLERMQNNNVKNGILKFMTRGEILLPTGKRIDGWKIAWILDGSCRERSDAIDPMSPLDDAFRRRCTINLRMDHLSSEQELQILNQLCSENRWKRIDRMLLEDVVHLGQVIRRDKADGNLLSLPPPTIYGYLAFLRMARSLPHLGIQQIATSTLLGNASSEDRKASMTAFNEVFASKKNEEDENRG